MTFLTVDGRRRAFLMALAGIFVVSTEEARASGDAAIDLLRQCEGREPAGEAEVGFLACAHYLDGVIDAHGLITDPRFGTSPPWFCLPSAGISIEQTVRIYVKWANDNPQDLHQTARLSVMLALRQAFPCN